MSLRVCFITSSFSRGPGDHSTPWLVRLIEELRPGAEVTVFAPSFRGLPQTALGSTPVHRFRYWPAGGEDLTHEDTAPEKMGSPLFAIKVASYIICGSFSALLFFSRRRFDVLHVHWPFPQGFFAAAALIFNPRARVVYHFHGSEVFLASSRPLLASVFRLLIRIADVLVANSLVTAGEARRIFTPPGQIEVIPFGTTLPEFKAAAGGDGLRLLFVGRLIGRKGLSYLLRALKNIRGSGLQATLSVAGDGPLRKDLERETAELGLSGAVDFKGYLPAGSSLLAAEYSACDIFILPSVTDELGNSEGLGMTAIDAMLMGKPVVAFASGGIASVISDGVTGFLAREKDPEDLARKIKLAFSDPGRTAIIAAEARRRAEDEFSWQKVTRKLLEIYTDRKLS
ncbi:MAG: hypothetical protein AUJ51_02600 [Elusimicrobia bacterium CG1_02_56_21]|nr:MAG: hypothetical protein AUJ51_02600 [Elusimicrobia bacterium CG1_02_56_21]